MPGFIEQNLMPGERLITITRIHPGILCVPGAFFVIGCLLLLVGLVIGLGISGVAIAIAIMGGIIAVIAGLVCLVSFLKQVSTEFGLTSSRIVIKTGIVTRQVREMPLSKVEALRIDQGILGRIIGFGTLVLTGSGGTTRTCRDIEEPIEFYKRAQEQVAAAQKHK